MLLYFSYLPLIFTVSIFTFPPSGWFCPPLCLFIDQLSLILYSCYPYRYCKIYLIKIHFLIYIVCLCRLFCVDFIVLLFQYTFRPEYVSISHHGIRLFGHLQAGWRFVLHSILVLCINSLFPLLSRSFGYFGDLRNESGNDWETDDAAASILMGLRCAPGRICPYHLGMNHVISRLSSSHPPVHAILLNPYGCDVVFLPRVSGSPYFSTFGVHHFAHSVVTEDDPLIVSDDSSDAL